MPIYAGMLRLYLPGLTISGKTHDYLMRRADICTWPYFDADA